MRVKIMDYLTASLPIITTEQGLEGLDISNGDGVLITDDVGDNFSQLIVKTVHNDEILDTLAHKSGINAKKLSHHNFYYKIRKFIDFLEKTYILN
jgi:hypothetical protein